MCSALGGSLFNIELSNMAYLFILLMAMLIAFITQKIISAKNTHIPNFFGPLIIFITATIMFSIEAYARAGGGGGGGGHARCRTWYCMLAYPIAFLYTAYIAYRINKKNAKVRQALNIMAINEPEWSEPKLLEMVTKQFIALQKAWGDHNLDFIKKSLHPLLYPVWEEQIKDHIKHNEKNVMENVKILKLRIVDVQNFKDDEKDEFTVCIDASANDKIISNGNVLSSNNSSFREFWTFENEKGAWLLKNVTQQNGWRRFVSARIIYEPKRK